MKHSLLLLLVSATLLWPSCADHSKEKNPASTFTLKETLVTGTNKGMTDLSGFKRKLTEIVSQRWELRKTTDASDELVFDPGSGERLFPGLALFRDSTAVENPRGKMRSGKWEIKAKEDMMMLILTFPNKEQHQYIIEDINSHKLSLVFVGAQQKPVFMVLTSDALVHDNRFNDPFYPTNNQWRIKPAKPESDSAIKERARQCIKFYALLFRDFIKRKSEKISFSGLPEIFEWYSRAIGLPDRDKIAQSWIDCFYNKEQAVKAYTMLRKLIVDNEFDWPTSAPGWEYETESVLEQMYHRF